MNFKRPLKAQKIRKITTIISVFLAIFFTFEFGVKRLTGKIDPLRGDYTKPPLDLSIRNFDKGFIEVGKNNKVYLEEKKIDITNIDTKECFEYYIK